MSEQEQLIALEREVIETRNASVELIVGWLDQTQATPATRRTAADWFDEAAIGADMPAARLARLVAAALRRGL